VGAEDLFVAAILVLALGFGAAGMMAGAFAWQWEFSA